MERPIAFVTGASRGIGAASAIALAEAGHDVAIGARTLREGDAPGGQQVPGSLESTAREIEKRGGEALTLQMDLLDRASLERAVAATHERWGRIDVMVNCAIYQGPGNSDTLLDTPLELLERPLQADVVSHMFLLKLVLPGMVERGSGSVINITSAVAYMNPPGPMGKGGWGFAYGVAKGGFDRIAGLLNVEVGPSGILAYNLDPGFVVPDAAAADARERYPGMATTPPAAIGASVAWLATSERAPRLIGKRIFGAELCRRDNLLPGWQGPATGSSEA